MSVAKPLPRFTPAEEEVLAFLVDGYNLVEIAEVRGTSYSAASFLAQACRRKAGVSHTRKLVPIARRYFAVMR